MTAMLMVLSTPTPAADAKGCGGHHNPRACSPSKSVNSHKHNKHKNKGKKNNSGKAKGHAKKNNGNSGGKVRVVYVRLPPKVVTKVVHVVRPAKDLTPPTRTVRVVVVRPEPDKVSPTQGTLIPGVRETRGEVVMKRVLIGSLAATLLGALSILTLFAGYTIGYKDKQRSEQDFIRAVLEVSALNRR